MSLVHFTLYVAGPSSRSRAAEANLRRLCDDRLPGRYHVAVVDVTEAPERAERARILTTPTVVKEGPGTVRRVTGDLGDAERLWLHLGLDALAVPPHAAGPGGASGDAPPHSPTSPNGS